jgi:outer membrane beta-barrel protein
LGGGLCLLAEDAHALQGGEDPALLPVLIDKRFGNRGLFQVSLQFSSTMATKYVQDTGGILGVAYNFTDVIGIELSGGYFASSETSIMDEIRQALPASEEPDLSGLYQLTWMANADLLLVPLYGKISFASEVDPAYDLFLLGGVGYSGLRRQVGAGDARTFVTTTSPIFNFGLGLRFYLNRWLGLRLALRDYFYPQPHVGNPDPDASAGGLTHSFNIEAGLQFGIGG